MDLVDELSPTACAACKHPKAFHRPNNGACYGYPDENRLTLSSIDLAEIELHKQFGTECWCPKYCGDPVEGKAQLLRHGPSALLLQRAGDAIKDGDYDFARRCYSAYGLKSGLHKTEKTIAEMLKDAPPALLQAESTPKSGSAVSTPKRRSGAEREKEVPHSFEVSEDYGTVRYLGKDYVLTRNQSSMMRALHQAYLKGFPDVEKLTLLAAIENEESQVKDSWKRSPLWGRLIVSSKRRGRYRLNLPGPAR